MRPTSCLCTGCNGSGRVALLCSSGSRRVGIGRDGRIQAKCAGPTDAHNGELGPCIVLALRKGSPERPWAPESLGPDADIDNC